MADILIRTTFKELLFDESSLKEGSIIQSENGDYSIILSMDDFSNTELFEFASVYIELKKEGRDLFKGAPTDINIDKYTKEIGFSLSNRPPEDQTSIVTYYIGVPPFTEIPGGSTVRPDRRIPFSRSYGSPKMLEPDPADILGAWVEAPTVPLIRVWDVTTGGEFPVTTFLGILHDSLFSSATNKAQHGVGSFSGGTEWIKVFLGNRVYDKPVIIPTSIVRPHFGLPYVELESFFAVVDGATGAYVIKECWWSGSALVSEPLEKVLLDLLSLIDGDLSSIFRLPPEQRELPVDTWVNDGTVLGFLNSLGVDYDFELVSGADGIGVKTTYSPLNKSRAIGIFPVVEESEVRLERYWSRLPERVYVTHGGVRGGDPQPVNDFSLNLPEGLQSSYSFDHLVFPTVYRQEPAITLARRRHFRYHTLFARWKATFSIDDMPTNLPLNRGFTIKLSGSEVAEYAVITSVEWDELSLVLGLEAPILPGGI